MTTDNEPPVDDGLVESLEVLAALLPSEVCREAADTITRLRAAVASSDENVAELASKGYQKATWASLREIRQIVRAVLAAIREKADGQK